MRWRNKPRRQDRPRGRALRRALKAVTAKPRPTRLAKLDVVPLKKPNETCPDHPETGDAQAKRVRHLLLAPPRGELDFERSVPSSRLEIKDELAAYPYRSAADFFFFFRSLRAA